MRRSVLAALATAFVTVAPVGHGAGAMTFAQPSALGRAAATTGLVEKATVICGNAGCAPVQVKRMQKHKMPTPMSARPAS